MTRKMRKTKNLEQLIRCNRIGNCSSASIEIFYPRGLPTIMDCGPGIVTFC